MVAMFDAMLPLPSLQSQHQLFPHLQPHLLPLPHCPHGPLQPLHASAAPGQRKLLAPIPPASPHHQLQRSVRGTLRPLSVQQKERQELLQEVLELAEEISLSEARALDQTGSFSPVDRRTPSAPSTLPLINPPIAPAVPAPPKTTRQFQSRLPRLKKTMSLNVVTETGE